MIEQATKIVVFSQSRDANFQKFSDSSGRTMVACPVILYHVLSQANESGIAENSQLLFLIGVAIMPKLPKATSLQYLRNDILLLSWFLVCAETSKITFTKS